jgi:hypothetical protein
VDWIQQLRVGSMASFCERSSEPSDSEKSEKLFDNLNDYQLLKHNSVNVRFLPTHTKACCHFNLISAKEIKFSRVLDKF